MPSRLEIMPFRLDSFARNNSAMQFVDVVRILLLIYVALQIVFKVISMGSIEKILNVRTLFHIGVNFLIVFLLLLAFAQPIAHAKGLNFNTRNINSMRILHRYYVSFVDCSQLCN